jgi:hypothetical protein
MYLLENRFSLVAREIEDMRRQPAHVYTLLTNKWIKLYYV